MTMREDNMLGVTKRKQQPLRNSAYWNKNKSAVTTGDIAHVFLSNSNIGMLFSPCKQLTAVCCDNAFGLQTQYVQCVKS